MSEEGAGAVSGDMGGGGDTGGGSMGSEGASPAPSSPQGQPADTGGAAPANDNGGQQAAPAAEEAPQRFKVGDHELTLEEFEDLRQKASDDYEHVVKAEGKEHRIKRGELDQYLSMGVGGLKRMQELVESRRKVDGFWDSLRGGGEGMLDAVDSVLDPQKYPEGTFSWAMEAFKNRFDQESELHELAKTDPAAALRRSREIAAAEADRKARVAQQRAERQRQQQEAQRRLQERNAKIPAAVKALGYPVTEQGKIPDMLVPYINHTLRQAADAGYDMEMTEVSRMAHQALRADIRGVLSHLANSEKGAAAVVELLGDDIGEAIRRHQLEQAKTKQAAAAPKPAPKPAEAPQDKVRRDGDRARQKDLETALRDFGLG